MSINLEKGQKISLDESLKSVSMRLGWDTVTSLFGSSIDLDASCAMFDSNKELVEAVSFRNLEAFSGAIEHSGDNLTGAGDGDDEIICVKLDKIPSTVSSIVFVVTSYRGQSFDKVNNCFARLVDESNGSEISIFKLEEKGSHTALIMCKLYRHNGAWKMSSIGQPLNAKVISESVSTIKTFL